ncbi:ras guanine nucleotide exchange factor domain-containing protein [Biscogniauxia mediterranea]|nr:ras guanine nucleotide exchange factor domain-containing protein [Biscogniauxia mediterranea]
MLDNVSLRSSLQVAPLTIQKKRSDSEASSSQDDETDASKHPYSQSQITPPRTPNESQEELVPQPTPPRPVFHTFLRAFYPFHPTYTVSDSTITLPLNEGDVVLVHSIHTNGWADGTLLVSGARGWLPTNYCEAYEPEEMRTLLKALLNFWDLLRSTVTNDRDIFGNQEFMKGIIAGVRYLLERTHCLTRESPTIQRNESLRRGRKSLLSELSSLVKTAKRLQETLREPFQSAEDVNDIIDEMILKAFKIVVKGVRFLDLLEDDRRSRTPAVTVMATVVEESFVPPTPPAESTAFENGQEDGEDAGSRGESGGVSTEANASRPAEGAQTSERANSRLSSVYTPANTTAHRLSQLNPAHSQRLSASISHRVSLAGPSPSSQSQNLVSERLNSSHDTFLSYLGSFIGRLHLQSQSRPELALAIKQSAISGGALLAVVNVVCDHNTLVSEPLELARVSMFDHIRDLVSLAREVLSSGGSDVEDVIMLQDNTVLLCAATGCVKAAGECVARTKWVLEKIGDFEFEVENGDLGIDLSALNQVLDSRPRTPETASIAESKASEPTATPARSVHLSMDKPLPEVPSDATPEKRDSAKFSQTSSRPQSIIVDDARSSAASSLSSTRPMLPPLPKLTTTIQPEDSYSPTTEASQDAEYHSSFRSDTGTASSSGTNSTYLSRDSETSMVSQTSTRATTPDISLGPKNQPSLSDMSTTGSVAFSEDVDEAESKVLLKTFAHELMVNNGGQVIGGSLPALVERLTTHESTPDAVFVSAFYLTFRLFCTPIQLAEALIERFDYVGEAPDVSSPVRLRVYNVMKGWLESHWRESTDHEALPIIQNFAEFKLKPIIPAAGRRLMDLTERVSSADGSLVPRLVPLMAKSNASGASFVPADMPLPVPILSKSHQNLLNNWKSGGSCPTILDFEALEIARQLTLKQMSVFCSIMPEELLGSQWMKNGGADSPNVKAMSGFSNDLSNLVADTILQYPEVKKRAAMIKQWIKIAQHCFDLNNYDGLMAIVCSLNSSIINRLRKTWDTVSPRRREALKALQAVVDPSSNHKALRARLQNHVPPCLPFLGMFLTDLTFNHDGNPPTKQLHSAGSNDQGLEVVNFDKHCRTAKIIGELQRFQIPYKLSEVADMQEWIQAQVVRVRELDQSNVQVSYYRKSLLLEPREITLRTPVEGPAATPLGAARGFGWMSRDRHHNNSNPTNPVVI